MAYDTRPLQQAQEASLRAEVDAVAKRLLLGTTSDALWWPPSKIAGSCLGDYLTDPPQIEPAGAHRVETLIPRRYPAPLL